MQKWEYKSEYIALYVPGEIDLTKSIVIDGKATLRNLWQQVLEEALSKYGDDGWELVSISDGLAQGDYVDGYALFKRPKED